MPDPEIHIRRLGPDDLGSHGLGPVDALLDVFGEAFEEEETYGRSRPGPDYLKRLLGGETFILLAAEWEGRIVGGVAAYVLEKYEQARREIYLYDLAVAESHRRLGVGTALLRHLESLAAELGVYVVFVQTESDNDPAIALYESFAAGEPIVHFEIEIPADRGRVPHR